MVTEDQNKTGTVLFDFKEDEEDDVPGTLDFSSDDEIEETKPVLVTEKKSSVPTVVEEKKKEENYEGMEDWEIELRRAAI